MHYKLRHFLLFLPAILVLILYFIPGNFELYTRAGWVDSGMYTGYTNNGNLITDYGFTTHNYQGSRLGYVVPARLFSKAFGPLTGRYAFVICFFLATLIALTKAVQTFSNRLDIQSIFITLIICNPLLLAGISFGGADGIASTYTILSATFLFLSKNSKKYNIFFGLAGFFAALSFSTHVLAIIPLLFLFGSYLITEHDHLKLKVIAILSAFIATIAALSIIGYCMGIEKNYLSYSLGWGVQSVKGVGARFTQPIEVVLKYSLIYVPPLIIATITLKLLGPLKNFKLNLQKSNLLKSMLLSIGPILFFFLYDKVLHGAISQYLSYYQLFYPCFIFSLLFLLLEFKQKPTKIYFLITNVTFLQLFVLSIYQVDIEYLLLLILFNVVVIYLHLSNERVINKNKIFNLVVIYLLLSTQYLFYVHNTNVKPFFHLAGHANTKELYKSEIAFIDSINKLPRAYSLPYFIFDANAAKKNLQIGEFYYTYFNGSKNIFTYFDSFTALYLWDRSILSSNPYSADFINEIKDSDHSKQIVIIGKNNHEVESILKVVSTALPGIETIKSECYQSEYYPWCIKSIKQFKNQGKEIE